MRCPRSKSRLALWSANCHMEETTCLGQSLHYPTSSSCRVLLPSASRKKAKPCIRNTLHSAGGGSGWKICQRRGSCVRCCHRASPYLTRANGQLRIAPSTDAACAEPLAELG